MSIFSFFVFFLFSFSSYASPYLDSSELRENVDVRVESNFYKYFERKHNINQYEVGDEKDSLEYINKELSREERIYDYVRLNPDVVLGGELDSIYSLNSKKIKLKFLINLLSSLGAKIYIHPNSYSSEKVVDRIVIKNKNIREIGTLIASKYGVGIRYYKASGIYMVD